MVLVQLVDQWHNVEEEVAVAVLIREDPHSKQLQQQHYLHSYKHPEAVALELMVRQHLVVIQWHMPAFHLAPVHLDRQLASPVNEPEDCLDDIIALDLLATYVDRVSIEVIANELVVVVEFDVAAEFDVIDAVTDVAVVDDEVDGDVLVDVAVVHFAVRSNVDYQVAEHVFDLSIV